MKKALGVQTRDPLYPPAYHCLWICLLFSIKNVGYTNPDHLHDSDLVTGRWNTVIHNIPDTLLLCGLHLGFIQMARAKQLIQSMGIGIFFIHSQSHSVPQSMQRSEGNGDERGRCLSQREEIHKGWEESHITRDQGRIRLG